ncbi:hypothetical protein O6P43_006287 [Quillaja saponaria]|uniref:Uncharacterized protein n=1 Tax=Quillaja saponaria TaxID=32244 RepID=A0AAD7Q841_QUISA|nr:hypothetical protein O6P43_006287 [Quillaja saponaria]
MAKSGKVGNAGKSDRKMESEKSQTPPEKISEKEGKSVSISYETKVAEKVSEDEKNVIQENDFRISGPKGSQIAVRNEAIKKEEDQTDFRDFLNKKVLDFLKKVNEEFLVALEPHNQYRDKYKMDSVPYKMFNQDQVIAATMILLQRLQQVLAGKNIWIYTIACMLASLKDSEFTKKENKTVLCACLFQASHKVLCKNQPDLSDLSKHRLAVFDAVHDIDLALGDYMHVELPHKYLQEASTKFKISPQAEHLICSILHYGLKTRVYFDHSDKEIACAVLVLSSLLAKEAPKIVGVLWDYFEVEGTCCFGYVLICFYCLIESVFLLYLINKLFLFHSCPTFFVLMAVIASKLLAEYNEHNNLGGSQVEDKVIASEKRMKIEKKEVEDGGSQVQDERIESKGRMKIEKKEDEDGGSQVQDKRIESKGRMKIDKKEDEDDGSQVEDKGIESKRMMKIGQERR